MAKNGSYIAFFDLDKTLLTINSSKPLILASYKNGLLNTRSLAKAIILSIIYKLRLKNPVKITGLMAKWLKGIPETSVEELSKKLVQQKLIYRLRPSIVQEIERHKKQGALTVILSAALPYVCNPIAHHLGMDDVICSTMEIVQGVFTGKPEGKICIDREKEIRIRQYCLDNSYSLQETYCYGDSYSDRFVLEAAGNPICVAPDQRLRKLSKIKKWSLME